MICQMLRPLDRRWLVNGWAPGDGALHKALISEYQRIHDILQTRPPSASPSPSMVRHGCTGRQPLQTAVMSSPHFQTWVTALRQPNLVVGRRLWVEGCPWTKRGPENAVRPGPSFNVAKT